MLAIEFKTYTFATDTFAPNPTISIIEFTVAGFVRVTLTPSVAV